MAKEKRFLVNLAPAVSTDVCRWLFEHWGMPLEERLHVPVFHVLALHWYKANNDQRPLIVDGPDKYRTEEEIFVHYDALVEPDKRLVPDDPALRREALDLRTYFHREMRGPGVVKYSYWEFLKQMRLVWRGFTIGTPKFEIVTAWLLFPLLRVALIKGLDLSQNNADKGLEIVREGFDKVDALLADGRPYLVGDRFTIADLTFAASAAPMVLARGYAGNLPLLEDLPKSLQATVLEFRDRPAGKYCQRMYDLHRQKR